MAAQVLLVMAVLGIVWYAFQSWGLFIAALGACYLVAGLINAASMKARGVAHLIIGLVLIVIGLLMKFL